MMFRTAALATFLAATTTTVVAVEAKTLCHDYSDLALKLGPADCTGRIIKNAVRDYFKPKQEANPVKCKGGSSNELMAVTGTTDLDAAFQVIEGMCLEALNTAAQEIPKSDWGIEDVDLGEYFKGDTFLNLETGNFQQNEDQFNKRGGSPDAFITVSTDPRSNDHYPTTEASYAAGEAVKKLYEEDAQKKYFKAPGGFENGCASNTAMCCWHRDRQYFDKNGNCDAKDCANQNPSDNTDLCWTEHKGDVFPYPGDKTENNLHCHGISWGDDTTGYDINTEAKWNALFYVSMYDHMYTRGYVESLTNDDKIVGDQPMCGCIEDMAPVARADCEQVEGKANYTVEVNADGQLVINHVPDSFRLEFESCEGYNYVDLALEPTEKLKDSDNDLSGFVFRQHIEGKLSDVQVAMVEKTLVGYRDPTVNNSDNAREEACRTAFEERYPNLIYDESDPIQTTEINAD